VHRRRILYSVNVVFLAAIALVVMGLVLWLPSGAQMNRDSELGTALLGGAAVAFTVAWAQTVSQHQAERRNLQLEFSRSGNHHGINLSRRDLTYLRLTNCDLSEALLGRAHLGGADLRNADLRGADLRSATLSQTIAGYRTTLSEANLERANLSWVRASWSSFSRANLDHAILVRGRFNHAEMSGATLRNAALMDMRLRRAKCIGVDFSHSAMQGSDMRKANLTRCQFEEVFLAADLRKADLRGADFSKAKYLEHSDLTGSVINNETKWPPGFDPVAAGAVVKEYQPTHDTPIAQP
jgi:uncharacterized protein YjbI with pentapeptide repeats